MDREALQPAQKQGDVVVLVRVDGHVLHALFGRLGSSTVSKATQSVSHRSAVVVCCLVTTD